MTFTDDQIDELIAEARRLSVYVSEHIPGSRYKPVIDRLATALAQVKSERDGLREQVENQAHNLRSVLSTLRHVKDILNNSRYVGRARVASRILSRALDTEKGDVHADWCHTVIGCSSPGHCSCDVAFTDGEAS